MEENKENIRENSVKITQNKKRGGIRRNNKRSRKIKKCYQKRTS